MLLVDMQGAHINIDTKGLSMSDKKMNNTYGFYDFASKITNGKSLGFHFVYRQQIKTTDVYVGTVDTFDDSFDEMQDDCPPYEGFYFDEPEFDGAEFEGVKVDMPARRSNKVLTSECIATANTVSLASCAEHNQYESLEQKQAVAAFAEEMLALEKNRMQLALKNLSERDDAVNISEFSLMATTPFDAPILFDPPMPASISPWQGANTLADDDLNIDTTVACEDDEVLEPQQAQIGFEGRAYILAYKDKKSSEKVIKTALESDSNELKLVMQELNDFLTRNCGYKDFEAQWMNNSSHNSMHDNVRVITALNIKTGKKEVLFISAKTSSYGVDDKIVGLTNFEDIRYAITGLIINGALDFNKEALAIKGETCDDVPVVVLAMLDNPQRSESNFDNDTNSKDLISRSSTYKSSPFNRSAPDTSCDSTNRYICDVVSNDPHHTSTSTKKNHDVFDYSVFAHRSRHKAILKYNEEVADIAEPLLEKNWVFGGISFSKSYYLHWKKSTADGGNLENSLVLSQPFLGAFFKLSNRGFDLEIRETKGVTGSYQIAAYHKKQLSNTDFVPPATVEVSMNSASQSFVYKGQNTIFDIGRLLQAGWTDQTTSDKWNHERKYHVVTQGSLVEITSHWLWLILADQMLTADLKYAAYFKTKGFFESHYINDGTIYVDSHNKQVYSLLEGHESWQSSSYFHSSIDRHHNNSAPLEVVAIPLSGVKFKVGRPLFELYSKGLVAGENKYFSLFLSAKNEGFYSKADNHITYTLLEIDFEGDIRAVYSFVDISGAIKKMINVMEDNHYIKAKGMDVFDITRSVVATARVFGCDIGLGFSFESVKSDWSDRDMRLKTSDGRSITEIQDFDFGI